MKSSLFYCMKMTINSLFVRFTAYEGDCSPFLIRPSLRCDLACQATYVSRSPNLLYLGQLRCPCCCPVPVLLKYAFIHVVGKVCFGFLWHVTQWYSTCTVQQRDLSIEMQCSLDSTCPCRVWWYLNKIKLDNITLHSKRQEDKIFKHLTHYRLNKNSHNVNGTKSQVNKKVSHINLHERQMNKFLPAIWSNEQKLYICESHMNKYFLTTEQKRYWPTKSE